MTDTPVVLIIFSRERVTRRSIDALRTVAPRQLFVIADGPRSDHPEDAENCARTRAVLQEIDWPCDVRRRFADRNLGLEANVELGLDWVFGQVERAIVLEDDCIPDPSFFDFCDELLERYAPDARVWQIAGDNHEVPTAMFGQESYAFTTWASVWGWATWADRWHAHRAGFPRTHDGAEDSPVTKDAVRTEPAPPRPEALVTKAALRHFSYVASCTDGDAYGWDHHWWVTIMSKGGLSIVPAITMIENDGYGEGATHTRADKQPVPAQAMPLPLVHPRAVALNHEIEGELELILLRTDGRLSRAIRKLIRPFWLRSLIRRVISHPLVWPLVRRAVSR
ncbi:MAG: hemolytic protein HlpA [Marmoricola sp.]